MNNITICLHSSNILPPSSNFFKFIFLTSINFYHNTISINNALIRCLEEFKKNKFVPAEEAEKQIKLLNFPLSVEKLVDAIKKVFSNEKMRVQTIESMEEIFEEMKEFSYIMKGAENDIFLHGKGSEEQIYNNDGNSVVQQHRKWLIVMADFPKVFVAQLRDMIYPKSYVHRQKETCWYILKQIY